MPITIKKGPAKKGAYEDHLSSPTDLEMKTMIGQTTVQKKVGSEVKDEKSSHHEFTGMVVEADLMAQVTVTGGRTVNLGNFNSVKIGVSLTVPCSVTAIDEAYNHAVGWVTGRINEALEEAEGSGE